MKKLLITGLGIALTGFMVTGNANTYQATFNNSIENKALTEQVTQPTDGTIISCSGDCNSLPYQGNATYQVTNNNPNYPWGLMQITFAYPVKDVLCPGDHGVEVLVYNLSMLSPAADPAFTIEVGMPPPAGYGSLQMGESCSS